MRTKIVFVVLVFFTFGISGLSAQENLTWGLALMQDGKELPFSQPLSMKNGEKFSIDINTKTNCYAYVLVKDSEGKLFILNSRYMQKGTNYNTGDIQLQVPGGAETFFVVMSSVEQKTLQEAINAYNKNKSELTADGLNNALITVRREASRFRENPAIPRSMGAAIRGVGVEYSGVPIYVKTIIINH
jgi:hypothetical protein